MKKVNMAIKEMNSENSFVSPRQSTGKAEENTTMIANNKKIVMKKKYFDNTKNKILFLRSYVQLDVLLAMISYCMITPLVTFGNKYLFSNIIDMPITISCMQQIAIFLFIFLIGNLSTNYCQFSLMAAIFHYIGPVKVSYKMLKALISISILFVLMIAFSNICLKDVMISSYQVARSSSLIFNVILSFFLLKQRISYNVLFSCFLVISGFLLSTFDSRMLSIKGAIFGALSSLFGSFYMVVCKKKIREINKILFSEKKDNTELKKQIKKDSLLYIDKDNVETVLVVHVAINSIILFFPLIFITGEVDAYKMCQFIINMLRNMIQNVHIFFFSKDNNKAIISTLTNILNLSNSNNIMHSLYAIIEKNVYAFLLIAITGILASLIPYTTYMCLKVTSPLTCTMVGFMKTCIQTLGGLVLFNDKLTLQGIFGVTLCLFGILYYSYSMYYDNHAYNNTHNDNFAKKSINSKKNQ